MKKTRKIVFILLVIMATICCVMAFSCCEETKTVETVKGRTERILCKADDFQAAKNNWYGSKDLVSNQARSIATQDLIIGEKYYFVYTFELIDVEPSWQVEVDGADYYTLYDRFQFSIKSWETMYYATDAVTFFGMEYDDKHIDASFRADTGELELVETMLNLRSYIAIEFSPKYTGSLYVESLIYGKGYKKAADPNQRISANVFENEQTITACPKVQIANLDYGLVGQDVYESGMLDEVESLTSISEMHVGRNYVVVDFDVVSDQKNDEAGEVYCGIYMHAGAWENVTLEQANTAKFSQKQYNGGQMFDFSYKADRGSSKHIRTVLSFTALDVCLIDLEFFVYSDNTSVTGTTYNCDFFAEENVTQLTYRFDENTQTYRVSGYEEITDSVIIPDHYKGFPVLAIDQETFASAPIKTAKIGDNVEVIEGSAFENCTLLTEVTLGKSVREIKEGFCRYCTSLKSIRFPEGLINIGKEAFKESGLQNAYFDNPYGWMPDGEKKPISITKSTYAAKYLVETYENEAWRCYSVLSIENMEINVYDQQNPEKELWDSYAREWVLEANQWYTLVIDAEVKLTSVVSPFHMEESWGISLTDMKNYEVTLMKKTEEKFDGEVANRLNSGIYAVWYKMPDRAEETVKAQIIYLFKPISGSKSITLELELGMDVLFENGTYQDEIDLNVSRW